MFLGIINMIKDFFFMAGSYSNTVFPEPLSNDEEEQYIENMLKGDKEARNMLIEHNLRLVAHIVKKYETKLIDSDDLISIGTIGLIKAIDSYNLDKSTKITTYAARCIENEILMYLRRAAKLKNEVSFDEPLNTDSEGNELVLSDVMGTDSDSVFKSIENGVENDILKEALAKLNEREKEIMELRYGLNGEDEKTQKEVADMLGISQSYISRLEKKIIGRLKKEFAKMI